MKTQRKVDIFLGKPLKILSLFPAVTNSSLNINVIRVNVKHKTCVWESRMPGMITSVGVSPHFYMISGVKKRKILQKTAGEVMFQNKSCSGGAAEKKKVSGKENFKIKSTLLAKIPVRVRLQNKSLQRTK